MKLRLHPEVETDIRDAVAWYESKRQGLGDELLGEIDQTFARVCDVPETFQVAYGGMRRAVLKRFPYVVYFQVSAEAVDVFGVLHGRRNRRTVRERAAP